MVFGLDNCFNHVDCFLQTISGIDYHVFILRELPQFITGSFHAELEIFGSFGVAALEAEEPFL
jgi:hypothetical protein